MKPTTTECRQYFVYCEFTRRPPPCSGLSGYGPGAAWLIGALAVPIGETPRERKTCRTRAKLLAVCRYPIRPWERLRVIPVRRESDRQEAARLDLAWCEEQERFERLMGAICEGRVTR